MIVGPIQFEQPAYLLLAIPALLLVWWFGRHSLSGLGSATRRLAFAVRVLVVLLVVAALADPHHRDEHDAVVNIVVADLSESMGTGIDGRLREYLDGATAEGRAERDRVAIVSVAKQPLAQLLPSASATPSESLRRFFEDRGLDPGDREGTNLADAVQLSIAMRPDDAAARITLLSDGNETEGSLLEASRSAKAANIPIDVLPVETAVRDDVVFSELVAPNTGRKGQTIEVNAILESTSRTRGRLEVLLDGEPLDLSPGDPSSAGRVVDLEPGPNRVPIRVVLPRGGPLTFEAAFAPLDERDDALVQNNRQLATTFVSSEGRVLILTNDPEAARPLALTMEAREIDTELTAPVMMPRSLVELQAYDAVVMFDVPQADFSGRQQRDLAAYVHESGGGLVMVGGPNSFGAGGWINTPIADVLPVRLDPPAKRQIAKGALALVIDNSGSMSSAVGGTGVSQLEIAKEGAIAAINTLSERDDVAVVRFDSNAELVVALNPASQRVEIADRVRRISSGGGTNMQPGIQMGLEQLLRSNAAARHMIVLSDGHTGGDASRFSRLVQRAIRENISITTISIGDMTNDPLMQQIATQTGGTFYPISISGAGVAQLPEILIQEAQTVRRSLIWEGDAVQPRVITQGVPTMAGFGALPPVSGYVVTADRGGTSLITAEVQTDPDTTDPLVAQWQHGLGRVVAFTSDATARWSSSWLDWASFQAFWEQHVRWVMRSSGDANLNIVTRNDGDTTRVIITALDDRGEPVNFGAIQARVAREGGAGAIDAAPMTLTQSGPGRYEGAFNSADSGNYLVTVNHSTPTNQRDDRGELIVERGFASAAVVRPFADEFRSQAPNLGLLERVAQETGGRLLSGDPSVDDLFERAGLERPVALSSIWLPTTLLALAMFLADVGVRRVRLSPMAVWRTARRAVVERKASETGDTGSLRAARERARGRYAGASSSSAAKAAVAQQKQQAATKFEASADAMSSAPSSPVDRVRPAPATHRKPAPSVTATSEPEEAGMSRLLAAKRRAADERFRDDDNDEGQRR